MVAGKSDQTLQSTPVHVSQSVASSYILPILILHHLEDAHLPLVDSWKKKHSQSKGYGVDTVIETYMALSLRIG